MRSAQRPLLVRQKKGTAEKAGEEVPFLEKERAFERYPMIVPLLSTYGYPYLVIIERKIANTMYIP